MPTHLFCLLPARSRLVAPAAPAVRVLDAGSVVAWVADAPAAKLSRDVRDAARATLEHDRVVGAALLQGVTPVPALLADPYGDDALASADILTNAAAIDAALERVHGMVEMTVIIGVDDVPPSPEVAGRGRAYLEQLRSLPERAGEIADRVTAGLHEIAGDPRRRAEGGRVGLSHLILRTRIDDYRRLAQSQLGAGYRIVIDGPRAPYSFARFSPHHGIVSEDLSPAA
jgi:hypothetical protein